MENEVAIMMPVYNGEKTLPLAIASLLYQTYTNWKCYIVNDGSSDGTKKYLDSLSDDRFVTIHFKKNRGRPYARNAALKICKGFEFIAFLDADDFYHPDKLKLQVDFLRKNMDVDLVSCGMGSFSECKGLLRVRGANAIQSREYNYNSELIAPRAACMIRSKSLGDLEFNSRLKMAQDSDFFMRFTHGKQYAVIGDVLYYYSEFDSVTKKKVLQSHSYNILRFFLSLNDFPLSSMIQLSKSILKLVYFAIKMPFVSISSILKNRGKSPTERQEKEFNAFINRLK